MSGFKDKVARLFETNIPINYSKKPCHYQNRIIMKITKLKESEIFLNQKGKAKKLKIE